MVIEFRVKKFTKILVIEMDYIPIYRNIPNLRDNDDDFDSCNIHLNIKLSEYYMSR